MKRFSKYFLAMLLPLAVLLVRPLTPAAVLLLGEEIRLSTEPVDPRDIFRGDYVTLRFSIETPGLGFSEKDRQKFFSEVSESEMELIEAGKPYAYVSLAPGPDGIHQAVKISFSPPEGLYLRAAIIYDGFYRLDYGNYLQRYYVRENTGRELEDAARSGELTAVAKVWKGRAVLTSVEMAERKQTMDLPGPASPAQPDIEEWKDKEE